MRLIAKKPCEFGGKKFYIGEEIPAEFVAKPKKQERLGVIAIANDTERVSGGESGTFYTQKQKKLQEAAGVLQEEGFWSEDTVIIPVKGGSDGDNEQQTAVPATPEEIRKVFSVMQMNAEEGAKEISGIKRENVLILLHAADGRKTIRDAAKKQADNIFSASGSPNESTGGNAITGANTEGADT